MKRSGMVCLVGTGPGDPALLTMRAVELIGLADVIVHDATANAKLVRLIPARAERIVLGPDLSPGSEEIARLLIGKAETGRRVVRLLNGDPCLDMPGIAEVGFIAEAGARIEVVPGVPFLSAAAAHTGIPLAHNLCGSGYTVFVADTSGPRPVINWDQLCRTPGTRVILGAFRPIDWLLKHLLAVGLAAGEQVALIRPGATGRLESITGSLGGMKAQAEAADFTWATIVAVGEVAALRKRPVWVERLPLSGKRVVVTRARDQAEHMARLLSERGAEVLEVPCIKTEPPTKREPLLEALAGLGCYDWLVFTSANGVTAFFNYFFRGFEDLRDLGAVRIAAVGSATAACIEALHLKVDLVSKDGTALVLARDLAAEGSLDNLRILLLRAEVATPELPTLLEEKGAIVDDIACYRTALETEDLNGAAASLVQRGADWITFTSGSTVVNCNRRFSLTDLRRRFPGLRLASIGPETTKALAALSLKTDVEARPHTMEALVAGVERLAARSTRTVLQENIEDRTRRHAE